MSREHKAMTEWAGRHAGPLHRALGVDENADEWGLPRFQRPSVVRSRMGKRGLGSLYVLAVGGTTRVLGTDAQEAKAELHALARQGGWRG